MRFSCPGCGAAALMVEALVELGPDQRWSVRQAQILRCGCCGFTALAGYLEGADARWSHRGVAVDAGPWMVKFLDCPRPRDAACGCATHRDLAARDWQLSDDDEAFDVKVARR